MPDVANFRGLLRWENLDFGANCSVWGNWLATFVLPNPWNPVESLDGGNSLTLQLMIASVDSVTREAAMSSNITMAEQAGEVMGWWTQQMYDMITDVNSEAVPIDIKSDFWKNVVKDLRRGALRRCKKRSDTLRTTI